MALFIERPIEWRASRIGDGVAQSKRTFPFRLQANLLLAMPAEPTPVIVCFVYRDAIYPGFQTALSAEGAHVAEYFEEDFLHDVMGVGGIIEQTQHKIVNRMLKSRDQRLIGFFTASLETFQQAILVDFGLHAVRA